MAHIYMHFDFGADEEKAQEARHKLDGWKQAFRLDKKLQYKMERPEDADEEEAGSRRRFIVGAKIFRQDEAEILQSQKERRGILRRYPRQRELAGTPVFLQPRKTVRATLD